MPLPDPVVAWAPEIDRWSRAYALSADLVAVVMTIESCGDPTAVSRAGALGLFQVMPFHFEAGEAGLNPEVNARRGLGYLNRALELSGGDEELALAGYNGGHGLITRPYTTWPAETIRYVAWGTGILQDLRLGRSPSPTLQAWLDAGGAHLCRSASRHAGF
jgi:soluble lytic murein transglycosylase-like protein